MTIWKYELSARERQEISMPHGAVVLTVQVQNGVPCLWALVDSDAKKEPRVIWVVGTGHDVPGVGGYVGTVQLDWLVFHVFEGELK